MRLGAVGLALVGIGSFTVFSLYTIRRADELPPVTARMCRLHDSAIAYYQGITGGVLGHLPPSVSETPGDPTTVFCRHGIFTQVDSSPAMWEQPTWLALGFAPVGKLAATYTFTRSPDGNGFAIRARDDIDCDGVPSTFERVISFTARGEPIEHTQ